MVSPEAAVAYPADGLEPFEQARSFLRALTGGDGAVTFQTFHDGEGSSSAPPAVIHARLEEVWDRLLDLNDHGHGIFVMVNGGDGLGRAGANVRELRALFADNDRMEHAPHVGHTVPNLVVRSGHGWHYYWLLQPGESPALFTSAQRAIATKLGTDGKVVDLARVLRLPGTFNVKDRSKPLPVQLVHCAAEPRRTIGGVLALLHAGQAVPEKKSAVLLPVSGPRVLGSDARFRAERYIATIRAVEGQDGDDATFQAAAALVKDFALDRATAWDLFRQWNQTNAVPPWDEVELGRKFQNAERHGKAPIGGKLADTMERATSANADAQLPEQLAAPGCPQPNDWVLDRALNRWREYRGGAWREGITESALDTMLELDGKLSKRAIGAWKKKTAGTVAYAEPVYGSSERIAVAPDGARVANTFRRPILVPSPGSACAFSPPDAIWRVLRNLAGDDDAATSWLVGWLGKMVQNAFAGTPRRIGTALVLHGPKGAGKGVLAELVKGMLGSWNVAEIGQSDLQSDFNSFLDGALCVFADEVFTSDTRSASLDAKVKQLVTAHELTINRKGVAQVKRPCVANVILAANTHRPVELNRGDRRYTVLRTGGALDPELGALVADDARAGGPLVRSFLAYLLHLEPRQLVSDYRPLETEAKDAVARAGGNSASKFAHEVATRGFWSVTGAWAAQAGCNVGPRELYLCDGSAFRSVVAAVPVMAGFDALPVPHSPLLLVRDLLKVYRAYAQEIGAPFVQETAFFAALREELGPFFEGELLVAGRRERVVAGLPLMLPEAFRTPDSFAPPEAPLPAQRTLAL